MPKTESPSRSRITAAVVMGDDERLGFVVTGQFSNIVITRANGLVWRAVGICSIPPSLDEE
jgi:hypothetical protein